MYNTGVEAVVRSLTRKYSEDVNGQERNKILEWLPSHDDRREQDRLQDACQPSTGGWFLDTEEFCSWHSERGKTLSYQGMPGAGKTHMFSLADHSLQTSSHKHRQKRPQISGRPCLEQSEIGLHQEDPQAQVASSLPEVAYIYYSSRTPEAQTVKIFIGSLLSQLSRYLETLPNTLKELYNRHQHTATQPSIEELKAVFSNTVSTLDRAYIIVDGLTSVD